MDQLFTAPECRDMLGEVLAYLIPAIPAWAMQDYKMVYMPHAGFVVSPTSPPHPRLSAESIAELKEGIKQYLALTEICSDVRQAIEAAGDNPLATWRGFIARLCINTKLAYCVITDIWADVDGSLWPVIGQRSTGRMSPEQVYIDFTGADGIMVVYLPWCIVIAKVRGNTGIYVIANTIEGVTYAIDVNGQTSEEVYNNALAQLTGIESPAPDAHAIIRNWGGIASATCELRGPNADEYMDSRFISSDQLWVFDDLRWLSAMLEGRRG